MRASIPLGCVGGALLAAAARWAVCGEPAETLPDVRSLPASFQRGGAVPKDESVYGQVRFGGADAGPAYVTFGDTNRPPIRVELSLRACGVFGDREAGGRRLAHRPLAKPLKSLEFSFRDGLLRLYANGEHLWAGTNLWQGPPAVNAWAQGGKPEVVVQRLGRIQATDDFMRETIGLEDAWFPASGWWRSLYRPGSDVQLPNPFVCAGSADQTGGFLLTGHVFWNNIEVSAAVRPQGTVRAALVFAWQDARNHGRLVLDGEGGQSRLSLVRLRDGREYRLGERALVLSPGRWSRLTVRCREGEPVEALFDRVKLFEGPSNWNTHGKVGFGVSAGTAWFDDFAADTVPRDPAADMPAVGAVSRRYGDKPYERRADEYLFRWAKDQDAWERVEVVQAGERQVGARLRIPLFGDFEYRADNPGGAGLVQLTDWLGRVLCSESLRAGTGSVLARRGATLSLDGRAIGTAGGAEGLRILLARPATAGGAPPKGVLRSASSRQDLFETAPVDWLPIGGEWENSNRWKCEPEWIFFSGWSQDDAALMSKAAFEGNQVHEVYWALKDLFNRQFEHRRYRNRDIGISFLTDGHDLFSGYTLLYGGFDNAASYLYRGRDCVATNRQFRFSEFRPDKTPDEHYPWYRFRIERVESRIRIFLEDGLIFDYTEEEKPMPRGGHLAVWTCRNGLMLGRLNSSAEAIRPDAEPYVLAERSRDDLRWKACDPSRVQVNTPDRYRVRVTNRFGGGDFAVQAPFERAIDLREAPKLTLDADIPRGVKVAVHARINGRYFVHTLTAPLEETYRVLGDDGALPPNVRPTWRLYASEPLGAPVLCGQPRDSVRGFVTLDLLEPARQVQPNAAAYSLDLLYVGNTSHKDYLMVGLSGNAAGSSYTLTPPSFHY